MTAQAGFIRAAGLHPDDIAERHAAARRLVELRAGLSQTAVGQILGVTGSTIHLAETSGADPQLDRLQRHHRALGHRLVLNPQFDPDLPADPTTAVYRTMAVDTPNPDLADMCHRSATLRHLIARRRWLGLSARDISTHLGRSHSWLGQIEQDVKPPMLSTYQLYTRAVGGRLELDVEAL